jgi:hypothetical protein
MAAWGGGRRHLRPPSAHRASSGYLALALFGCASQNAASDGAARAATPSAAAPSTDGARGEAEKTPRRGLGIAIDPELELPAAAPKAAATSGLLVLSAPVDVRPAMHVVGAFFEALGDESPESLERLLDRSARTRASPKARPEAALPSWRRRFERLDYSPLSTELVYRAADVKVYTAADATAPGTGRALPVVPKGEEILVRVFPIGQTAAKLMGGEIDFVMKPSAGGYKIGELVEDFRLP